MTIRELEEMAFPDDCNVELIDGVFYLKSAAPSVAHQKIAGDLFFQIKDYISRSSGRCVPFFAPTVYSFEQDIPVNIYSGQLSICLK